MKPAQFWIQEDVYYTYACKNCEKETDEANIVNTPKEPEKKAASKSYMWLYRTSGCTQNPIVLYEYQPNRKAEHAEEFLKDFSG